MRKYRIRLWLTALLLPAMTLTVHAALENAEMTVPTENTVSERVNADYSGPLDPLTGLPAGSRLAGSDADYTVLLKGVYGFDRAQGRYVNEVGERSFASTIPNGAILNAGRETVSFTIPGGLSAVLYRGGEALAEADLTNITEAGSYLLEVGISNSSEKVSFSFRLLDSLNNAASEFSLPAGFTFEYVRLGEETLSTEYSNYTQLIEDGSYEICWSCEEIGKRYITAFTLDTKAPSLALPEVTDGEARSQVTLTDLEPGAYILLTETDSGVTQRITTADTEIREAGTYHLTVYDQAGNSASYDFVIHVYLNISALAAIALVLAGLLSLWLYARYIRKHPRVG